MMRHVFLIGLSGSGKSTIGRLLAQRLGRPLLDVDALVEEECGERIPAIFAQHGEEYFRSRESQALLDAIESTQGAILATGGGIVTQPQNRALMAERGVRIYLHAEPEIALQRLQEQQERAIASDSVPETRPLLAGPDPLKNLQQLLEQRATWYEEAEMTCYTNGKSAERVVQEIIARLICTDFFTSDAPAITRHIQVGSGYDAVVDWGGLGRLSHYLKQLHLPSRVFLITDSNLQTLYAPHVMRHLEQEGFEPYLYVVPAGESSKSSEQLNAIYDWLLEQHAERKEALIALGGGVIGDLVGYAAATYLRGVPLIHVPTSLLAQVDSAIGGKTGINHPKGKNLIGAFYHPRLVLADPAVLMTLPVRERTEGWAEIVKYGIILDANLFAQLEEHADALRAFSPPPIALTSEIIARCIDLKAMVVEGDEREQGRRAILNYGHTIGHALENVSGYGEWLHGEAVSLGMVAAALIAQKAGMFAAQDVERQNNLLAALGLPTVYQGSVRAPAILAKVQLDKKVVSKRVRWVMPLQIGEVTVTPLPDDVVAGVVAAFFAQEGHQSL